MHGDAELRLLLVFEMREGSVVEGKGPKRRFLRSSGVIAVGVVVPDVGVEDE